MPVLRTPSSDDQRPAPLRLFSLAVIYLTCGLFLFSSVEAQADQRVFRQNLGANPVKAQTRMIHAPAYGDSRSASFSYVGFNRTGIARVDLLFAKPE